jgi:hypothetical protein
MRSQAVALEGFGEGNYHWHWAAALNELMARRTGTSQPVETSRDEARDAARYRFLRQPGNAIVYAKDRNAWGQNASGHVRYDTAEQLDAAVDAARGAEEPSGIPCGSDSRPVTAHTADTNSASSSDGASVGKAGLEAGTAHRPRMEPKADYSMDRLWEIHQLATRSRVLPEDIAQIARLSEGFGPIPPCSICKQRHAEPEQDCPQLRRRHSRDCGCHDCLYAKKHPQVKPHHALCGCFECAPVKAACQHLRRVCEATPEGKIIREQCQDCGQQLNGDEVR